MDVVVSNKAVARAAGVSLRYGSTIALNTLDLEVPSGCMVGLIGPDGVGKSSLLSLLAGARAIQDGQIEVLGGDMRSKAHRDLVCPRIAYMPQGLGKNLYPTLSVEENLQFFARLFGHSEAERRRRIDDLTKSTGLNSFLDRPAGKLSGGMKQKLGLCCALIHDPDFLLLDEPTTGVDPLARAQFWDLIDRIRSERPSMSVIVATAYMDEAQRFNWLVAMDDGGVLATGTPAEILHRTNSTSLEEAFIRLLPDEKKRDHKPVDIQPLQTDIDDIAIEAKDLTMQFGDFTAVDHVSFRIRRGEIFGFLGSNGCGKSTTMKMLTGLLVATEGNVWLFGREVDSRDIDTRRRVGYMSQAFSLYSELTVHQNLVLHAQLFHVPAGEIAGRVDEMVQRFGLAPILNSLPDSVPLGMRQRLSLAVAMVHRPELLILDEPTSGVDPVARDGFWHLLVELSRRDHVTIFISTHFMNEAARCDRISMMHAGKVLDSDAPARLMQKRGTDSLEEAFIGYLVDAGSTAPSRESEVNDQAAKIAESKPQWEATRLKSFSLQRLLSYAWREVLELRRDPIRATTALVGSLLLMVIMGFGINMDVNHMRFAVLDNDQSAVSRNFIQSMSGSRYFLEQPPIRSQGELDRRMQHGELTVAIEIPPGFGRDLLRGRKVEIAAWIDGAMPSRAETVKGYVNGVYAHWIAEQSSLHTNSAFPALASIQARYRYNPDVKSIKAMAPAIVALLLLLLPAMLTALAVVREKELGSIINLYVTPVTRTEFLIGKQLPYVGLGMVNFFCMCMVSVTLFRVPISGSFFTLTLSAILFCIVSTGMGLLASAITRSQIAALFITVIGTLIPAVQYTGLINPVSSLEGSSRIFGALYPATHMVLISRGVFSKALGMSELYLTVITVGVSIPLILGAAVLCLKKQEG